MAANAVPAKHSGCLMLFALPFAAVGVGMGMWLAYDFLDFAKTREWQEVPATIVRADLKSHSDSHNRTTYEAVAEYRYTVNSRTYTGHRVSLMSGSDNVGSFQRDAYRTLKQHVKSGRPFRCFVNPAQPEQSVLFRDLRWDMVLFRTVFATVFGSGGFGLLAAAFWMRRCAKRDAAAAAQRPDQPWLRRPDWAAGRVFDSVGRGLSILTIFTAFWCLMSIMPTWAFYHEDLFKQNRWSALLLVFPAIGVMMIVAVLVGLLRRWKYGRSLLEMASTPGVIGGQLAGVLHVSRKVIADDGFQLRLYCVQMVSQGEHSNESVLWQSKQTIVSELQQADPEKTAIPVLFAIPFDCLPTDPSQRRTWRLECRAKTPGLDFKTTFDVPVFRTSESSPNFQMDAHLLDGHVAPVDSEAEWNRSGVRKTLSPTGEGCRLAFPMMRQPWLGLLSLIAGIVFLGTPVFVYFATGDLTGSWLAGHVVATAATGLIFGLIGLILTFVAFDVWFYRSVVDISPQGLTIVGGWFGLGPTREIAAADVRELKTVSHMSVGSGAAKKSYYDIDVLLTSGKKITLGKRVLESGPTEAVLQEIRRAMGQASQTDPS
ncbi:MAG: DUF3592 domain-containing protein [Thermoguttaceae bacterium]